MLRCVERIEDNKPGVIHPAVRELKSVCRGPFERRAKRAIPQLAVDAATGGQNSSPAEMVVNEQAQSQYPHWPHPGLDRQYEAHRPHDMGRHPQHYLALRQRFAHKAKPPVLEVAQPAVNELGRRGRGTGRKIVLLDEEDGEPTAGCIAGDGRPVDAAADHGEVEIGYRHYVIPKSLRAPAVLPCLFDQR